VRGQWAGLVGGELVWLQNHREFLEVAAKWERHFALILLQNRGAGVLPDVEGFIEREANPYGPRDTTLRDLLFIHQQSCGRSLADAAAVIVEFDSDDMIAGRKRLVGGNTQLVTRLFEKRVGEDRLAILHHQAPPAVTATYRPQYTARPALRDRNLGGERPGFVFKVRR